MAHSTVSQYRLQTK